MTDKIAFSMLPSRLPLGKLGFVTFASFESRCRLVPLALPLERVTTAIVFSGKEYASQNEESVREMTRIFSGKSTHKPVSIADPIKFIDLLEQWLRSVSDMVDTYVVDVTTFTHEALLILLRVLDALNIEEAVLLYVGAASYGQAQQANDTLREELWLSRGVTEITSVLGYPGKPIPSQPLHVIALVGFESERANEIIGHLQPSKVSLGLASRDQSVSPELYQINAAYHQRVSAFVTGLERSRIGVRRFEFSAVDPEATKLSVLREASESTGFNVVVAPMNTKLSTVGCALAAMEDVRIQLCYARVAEYNVRNYSAPGNDVRVYLWRSKASSKKLRE